MKDKTLALMIVTGSLSVALTFSFLGERAAIGAVSGAALSLLNVLALKWIAQRFLATATGESKGGAVALWLMAKIAGLACIAWFLLGVVRVDLIGFVIGLGAALFGMLLGAGMQRPPKEQNARAGESHAAR